MKRYSLKPVLPSEYKGLGIMDLLVIYIWCTSKTDVAPWCYLVGGWVGLDGIRVGRVIDDEDEENDGEDVHHQMGPCQSQQLRQPPSLCQGWMEVSQL